MENLENFGRYHLLVLLVFGLQILSHGMNLLIMPFSHKEVPHRCFTENDRIKGLEEGSIVSLNDFLDIFSSPKENMVVESQVHSSETFRISEISGLVKGD